MGVRSRLKKIGRGGRSLLSNPGKAIDKGLREARDATGQLIAEIPGTKKEAKRAGAVLVGTTVGTLLGGPAAGVAGGYAAYNAQASRDTPEPEAPPPPPVLPQMDTEEIARVRRRYAAKMAGAGGRASTILTNAGDTLGG